ncbi:hypothetical protein RU50_005517 [Salmonella enterica subsp. enterica]|nr:hypothetical protein [Salmonella enterica subsp. enterica]
MSHDVGTKINAEIITGRENIREVVPDRNTNSGTAVTGPEVSGDASTGPDVGAVSEGNGDKPAGKGPSVPPVSVHEREQNAAAEVSLRQGAVNAQVTHLNQSLQDGFLAIGTPPVPGSGYQPVKRKVNISLCDGESCQAMSLDASKPAEGTTALSDR